MSSPDVIGFSLDSESRSLFRAGGDADCDDACEDDIGAINTLPMEVRTSFGDVASTTFVEFCRAADGCDDDALTTFTPADIAPPAALRDWVFAILTILVTPTCCALALVVELFGITCEYLFIERD